MADMDTELYSILKETVEKYGKEILLEDRGRRAAGLMADLLPGAKKENRILRFALNEGIAEKINEEIIIRGQDMFISRNRYVMQLCDDLGIENSAALFVVDCLCGALGLEGFDGTGERILESGVLNGPMDTSQVYEVLKEYTVIGVYAFRNIQCPVIEVPPNIRKIKGYAFSRWEGEKVILPGETELEKCIFGAWPLCTAFPDVVELPPDARYVAKNKCLMDRRTGTLVATYATNRQYIQETGEHRIDLSIPEGVVNIPEHAFGDWIRKISIPRTVKQMDIEGLRYAAWIEVDPENENYKSIDGVLFDGAGRRLLLYPSDREGAEYSLPSGTESVGERAFPNGVNLEKVCFNEELREIGDKAFWGHNGLKEISFSRNLRHIGRQAFAACKNLHFLEMHDQVEEIGEDAFKFCGVGNVSNSTLDMRPGESEQEIGKCIAAPGLKTDFFITHGQNSYVAGYCRRNSIECGRACRPGDLSGIGQLTERLRAYLVIGTGAFGSSIGECLEIPPNIRRIRRNAFSNCKGLRKVILSPDTVIEPGAFSGCPDLSAVEEFPARKPPAKSRYHFGNGCLVERRTGTLIYGNPGRNMPEGAAVILDDDMIVTVPKIYIPQSIEQVRQSNFTGQPLEYIEVAPGHLHWKTVDGVLYNREGTELLRYPRAKKDDQYQVEASAKAIGQGAFANAFRLRKVSLNEGLLEIGGTGFSNCTALTEVSLPRSLRKIGKGAFYKCENLCFLEIYDQVSEIEEYAFWGCGEKKDRSELKLIIHSNPYVEEYCQRNGIEYTADQQKLPKEPKNKRFWFGRHS